MGRYQSGATLGTLDEIVSVVISSKPNTDDLFCMFDMEDNYGTC
jgi:hypothetical protein